jgi:hypothetical protein
VSAEQSRSDRYVTNIARVLERTLNRRVLVVDLPSPLQQAAHRLLVSSCEAQGIEMTVADPVVIGKIAATLKGGAGR